MSARDGERVQKILGRAGVASRRAAEELIREGRVTVNGRVCELGDRANAIEDWIKVDGKTVARPEPARTLMLHKPRGVVTTLSDPEGRQTVIDLVPAAQRRALVPIGRLDAQTEGLLLLTTDGELAQRVAHPRYGCQKTYLAKVRGQPAEKELEKLRGGIVLEGRRTAPCEITPWQPSRGRRTATANTWWRVVLAEGRTRQIREMFQRIGHPVMRLRRIAIGPVKLDSKLRPGALRELQEQEVAALQRATAGSGGGRGRKSGDGGRRSRAPKERPSGKRSGSGRPRRRRS